MKKLLTLSFIFIFMASYCQDYYSENGDFHYKIIMDVEGKSQKELYESSKKWLAVNFNDLNRVLKLDSEGNIIVKGNFELKDAGTARVDFTMDIAFKDGKLKTEFYDVTVKPDLFLPEYSLTNPTIFTNEDFINIMSDNLRKAGLNEKQVKRGINEIDVDKQVYDINELMKLHAVAIEKRIDALTSNLTSYVNKEDDGW